MWRLVTEDGTRPQEAAWMEAEATAEPLREQIVSE
jgi:hypothetical protein